MIKATLFLTHATNSDDIIMIKEMSAGLYELTYEPNDSDKHRTFLLSHIDTMSYISDIMKSLDHDVDPFVHVQVTTAIHPSILYNAADLADSRVRHGVEDMINMALRTPVCRV